MLILRYGAKRFCSGSERSLCVLYDIVVMQGDWIKTKTTSRSNWKFAISGRTHARAICFVAGETLNWDHHPLLGVMSYLTFFKLSRAKFNYRIGGFVALIHRFSDTVLNIDLRFAAGTFTIWSKLCFQKQYLTKPKDAGDCSTCTCILWFRFMHLYTKLSSTCPLHWQVVGSGSNKGRLDTPCRNELRATGLT